MTIASLAMYPFASTRPAYDEVWDAVRARLSSGGPALTWDIAPDVACRRPDLLIGQTCGWPLVTTLASTVRVVGTFDCTVPGADDGTYRAALVTRLDGALSDILRSADLTVAANSPDSLSGWISLQSVARRHGVVLDRVEWTGSHAASVEALTTGRADLASIDAVSWAHLDGGLLDTSGLRIVGHGPQVPCLPIVTTGASGDSLVEELRRAFDDATRDPALAPAWATLRISRFLRRDLGDYEHLPALVQLG